MSEQVSAAILDRIEQEIIAWQQFQAATAAQLAALPVQPRDPASVKAALAASVALIDRETVAYPANEYPEPKRRRQFIKDAKRSYRRSLRGKVFKA